VSAQTVDMTCGRPSTLYPEIRHPLTSDNIFGNSQRIFKILLLAHSGKFGTTLSLKIPPDPKRVVCEI